MVGHKVLHLLQDEHLLLLLIQNILLYSFQICPLGKLPPSNKVSRRWLLLRLLGRLSQWHLRVKRCYLYVWVETHFGKVGQSLAFLAAISLDCLGLLLAGD